MPTAEKFAIIKTAAAKARRGHAGIAQLVVQLICNQQVGGSSPSAGSKGKEIPERRIHAKGWGACGNFTVTHYISRWTRAKVLQPGAKTELFLRFSTVAGSRGTAVAHDCNFYSFLLQ